MKTFISIAGVAALGVALSLALVSPSAADPAGDAGAGGVLGFMAGAAVGSAADGGGYYYRHDGYGDYGPRRDFGPSYGSGYGWRRHVRACFRAYGSDYDPRSNTYIDDYGNERRCRL
jgi:hypothetical protein